MIGRIFVEFTTAIVRHGDDTQRGLEGRREGVSLVDEGLQFVLILHGRTFHDKLLTLAPDFHLQPLGLLQEVEVEGVEVLGIEVDVDGLRLVDNRIPDSAFTAIFSVQFEILDHIAKQHARLQHLHLVVDTVGVGQEAEVFHAGQHLAGCVSLLVLILDQHTGRDLIDGLCIAEVDEGHAEADDE